MKKISGGILCVIAILFFYRPGFSEKGIFDLELELTIGGAAGKDAEEDIVKISGLDVDKDGNIYILEDTIKQVLKYDKNGNLVGRIGRRGQGPGEFSGILRAIALDQSGNIVVAELFRVVVFDKQGRHIKTFVPDRAIVDMIVDDRGEIVLLSPDDKNLFLSYTLEGVLKGPFGDPVAASDVKEEYKNVPEARSPGQMFFTNNGRLIFISPFKYKIYFYRDKGLEKTLEIDSPYFTPVTIDKGKGSSAYIFQSAPIMEFGRLMIVYLRKNETAHLDIYEDDKRSATISFHGMPLKIDRQGKLYTLAIVDDYPVIKRYKMVMK